MSRPLIALFTTAAVALGGSAFGQSGDLRGVTMRVLDDLGDVDAVVLELDSSLGDDADAAEGDRARGEDESAERKAADDAAEKADRFDEPEELHHPDDDELAEGRLEDRDVEQPAPPAP
jgi:hypothetical protein